MKVGRGRGDSVSRNLHPGLCASSRRDPPQYRCSFTWQFPGSARSFTISGIINGSKPETVTVLSRGGNSQQDRVLWPGHLLGERKSETERKRERERERGFTRQDSSRIVVVPEESRGEPRVAETRVVSRDDGGNRAAAAEPPGRSLALPLPHPM